MSSGTKFAEVFAKELEYIHSRRDATAKPQFVPPSDAALADEHKLQEHALAQQMCGLTISGGGIRSATFGLGILQGLAAEGFLKRIDYLSTVSGGGYIGAWLTAWLRHKSIEEVTQVLRPSWFDQQPNVAYQEPGEVQHLRRYSNYLAPMPSIFSLDGWTLIAIYVRNLLLNQAVFLLGAMAFYLLLRSIVELFAVCHQFHPASRWQELLLAVSVIVFLASVFATIRFASEHHQSTDLPDQLRGVTQLFILNVITAVCASLLFVSAAAGKWFEPASIYSTILEIALSLGVAHGALGYFIGIHNLPERITPKRKRQAAARGIVNGFFAGAICGLVLGMLLNWMNRCPYSVATMVVAGPPLFLVAFVLGNFLQIGLLGAHLTRYERERWSSYNARLLSFAVLWVAVLGISVFGPWLILKISDPQGLGSKLTAWLLGGTWIGATYGALSAGKSVSTSGAKNSYRELIARTGPAIFIFGLLVALSFAFHWGIYDRYIHLPDELKAVSIPARYLLGFNYPYLPVYFKSVPLGAEVLIFSLGLMALCIALTRRLAKVIGVNTFSLHDLYALRLIRCYLGAIRHRDRTPNLITNYDPADDMPLHQLQKRADQDAQTNGPYQILCAALNRQNSGEKKSANGQPVNTGAQQVQSAQQQQTAERLSFQDRKAESFVFTADYCGSNSTGYCTSKDFANGVTVGTAMAVSGAAVSPNSGYHSSPAVTALLTIFNSRLGAWFGNPGGPQHKVANPPGWQYLYRELLGNVNAEDDFVFVSDGGHFENMGVYELIRRRCRFIVCVDTWASRNAPREPGPAGAQRPH